MKLHFTVQAKIQRPVKEVFDAVYNPGKLTQYFTTAGASGPLDEGTRVVWRWSDYPHDVPVQVTKVVPNELIALSWEAAGGGYDTHVEMRFEALDDSSTLVKITESGWRDDEPGRKASYDNCHGWTQMTCCLKAWAEYGINLRKGFY
jgi:uncharacterized protein YndB with AHSA1/START domain